MRLVTRHITREILAPALSALVMATFLLLTTQILRVGEAAFGYGLALGDFLVILALLLPRFFVFALPLSVMVGVLACIGRLSEDRELLALGAAGLPPARLWPAPALVGLLATVISLGLSTYGEPWALGSLTQRLSTVVERNLASGLAPGVIHQDIPGVVLHSRETGEEGLLKDVFLHVDLDAGQATLAARRARLEATGGRGLSLRLEDGEMVRASPSGGRGSLSEDNDAKRASAFAPLLDRVRFQTASVEIDVADTADRRARFIGSLDALTVEELRWVMQDSSSSWQRHQASVAFHRRLAMPFACLSLSLLGLGMALAFSTPGSKGKGAGFVGGIGAMLGYYLLIRMAENLALAERASVPVLLWAPNVLTLVLGIILLLAAVRR